jgi:rhodanese-related sulfurtransferase
LLVAAHQISDLRTPQLFDTALAPSSSVSGSWSQGDGPDFVDSALSSDDNLVVVGADGVSVSPDASTWTQPELEGAPVLHGVMFGGWQVGAGLQSGFVAVGEQGAIYAAAFAEGPWRKEALAADQPALRAVALGEWYLPEPRALLVAVGDGGQVLSKLVGALDFTGVSTEWTSASVELETDLLDVAARLP